MASIAHKPLAVAAPAGATRVAAKPSAPVSSAASAASTSSAAATAASPDAFIYVATAAGSLLTIRCPRGVARTTVGELKRRVCEIRAEWVPQRQTLFVDRPLPLPILTAEATTPVQKASTPSSITATTAVPIPPEDATPTGETPAAPMAASNGAHTSAPLPVKPDSSSAEVLPSPTHVAVALAEDDRVLSAYSVTDECVLRLAIAALEWTPPQRAWIQVLGGCGQLMLVIRATRNGMIFAIANSYHIFSLFLLNHFFLFCI